MPETEPRERAPLADVLIDDITWRCATRARRAEWLQAITDLVDEAKLLAPTALPLRVYVTVEAHGIAAAFHDPRGTQVGRLVVPRVAIAPLFREYMQTLHSIAGSASAVNSPQLEALDIARRLTHDDAAQLLIRHCETVRPDHATARRLFTLLVLLTHDTTKLQSAPAWPG